MNYLRNSILATLIYYDCFDFPLTLVEVNKYLINPARISVVGGKLGNSRLNDIDDELESLIRSGVIGSKNGFYFLNGKSDLYRLRNEREKIAAQKWKKFLKMALVLSLAPYLRGIFGSGSMAINNTEMKSDFDVLIVAKAERLYTCRLFLWILSSLIFARRKRFEKVAPDKLCFNHYITDKSLRIRHESLFTAQSYANLKPVMTSRVLANSFFHANFWLNNYLYNFKPELDFVRRSVRAPLIFKIISGIGEATLNNFIGDRLEGMLKYFQQKRIKNNPVTYKSGGRIIYSDRELEFHPYSFEKSVLSSYKRKLKQFGIVSFVEEHDSGLRS